MKRFSLSIWRGVFVLLLVSLLAAWVGVARFYNGSYYKVRGLRGVHTEEFAVANLEKSVANDPSQGFSYVCLAKSALQSGELDKALEYQMLGMKSFNSVRAYAQLGMIYELLGRTDDAGKCYAGALLMYPKNVEVLQRLAILAYNKGDSSVLRGYVTQIHDLDMNNVNAYYLLAKDLDNHQDKAGALRNYIEISTIMSRVKTLGSKPIFKDEDVQQDIKQLVEVLKN